MWVAFAQYDVEGRKSAARLQHAPDLTVEPGPVGDVHGDVLQEHDVEMTLVEGEIKRVGGLEGYPPGLSRPFGQIARCLNEGLAEVDARDTAAVIPRQESRGAADA
jgi:hypothetical protein